MNLFNNFISRKKLWNKSYMGNLGVVGVVSSVIIFTCIYVSQFRCQFCDKGLINKQELDQHVLIHHTDHSKRPFKCETCGMAFVLKVFMFIYCLSHRINTKTKYAVNQRLLVSMSGVSVTSFFMFVNTRLLVPSQRHDVTST